MTDEQRRAIAQEIATFACIPDLAADEITARDYAEARGLSWNGAKSQLERQARTGRLTARLVYDGRVNRNVTGYRVSASFPLSRRSGSGDGAAGPDPLGELEY